jgi:hypothetical protein
MVRTYREIAIEEMLRIVEDVAAEEEKRSSNFTPNLGRQLIP